MMRKASLLVSSALLLFSACGEDETSGISTARSQMRPLVDAACDWMFGCCSDSELVYQVGGFTVDSDDCSERLIDAISAGVPLELEESGLSNEPAEGLLVLALSIDEGRVDVDANAVAECAKATRTRDCNVAVPLAGPVGSRCVPAAVQAEEEDPCLPELMFRGKQEVGQECDGPWECKEGLRCADFGITGVCALTSQEGENCFSDDACAPGLVCNQTSGSCEEGATAGQDCQFADPLSPVPGTEIVRCADGLTCDPIAQVCVGGSCAPGSPCDDIEQDSDCPQGFFCVGNSLTQATCQLPGLVDSVCNKGTDCTSGYCNPFTELCGELLPTGDPCFDDTECNSGFCFGGLCNPSFGAGMPCPSLDNRECQGGYCNDTDAMMPVCTAYSAEGGPCPNGNECDPSAGLNCVEALCLSLPYPNGTLCVDNSQCASQACFMGMCATGAVIGAPCRADGSTEPCILGSFCETTEGAIDGTCTELRRSGQPCNDESQCWGDCVIRFGQRMCDAIPAVSLNEAWCDGPS